MKSEVEIKALFLEIYNDLKNNPPLNKVVQHDLFVRLKTLCDVLNDEEIEKLYQEQLDLVEVREEKFIHEMQMVKIVEQFEQELLQKYFPNT